MWYFIKTPWWLKKLYGNCIWEMPNTEKIIYLSFDDGPHPVITPFVLDTLAQYNAKATFFCIGKNVVEQSAVYERIVQEGHAVGNHTFNHLNGWHTNDAVYLQDIATAKKHIDAPLFRPPYGRITSFQLKMLATDQYQLTSIMWTVLSGDFDQKMSKEKCLQNVLTKSGKGSIVVFHDSEKAFEKLKYALPKVLEHFSRKGYQFKKISGIG